MLCVFIQILKLTSWHPTLQSLPSNFLVHPKPFPALESLNILFPLEYLWYVLTYLILTTSHKRQLYTWTSPNGDLWWFWRKLFDSLLDCKEIKQVNPKGKQSWRIIEMTEAEAPVLWPLDVKSLLIGKDPNAGKDWGQKEKGAAEDEIVRYHHWLNGHESEQTLGDSEGQGSLACCSP